MSADSGAAVERLKVLATQSGEAMVTEGPVHPDHMLLGLCAEAYDLRAAADAESWKSVALPHRHIG